MDVKALTLTHVNKEIFFSVYDDIINRKGRHGKYTLENWEKHLGWAVSTRKVWQA